MKRKYAIPLLSILTLLTLNHLINDEISAAATGQCYPNKPSYQYYEPVILTINTPTGINDTEVLIYLPNGQINRLNIGKIGSGVWQYPIGDVGPPPGQRMVLLREGSNTLYTTYYMVIEPTIPPEQTSAHTVTYYQTFTDSSIITKTITEAKIEVETIISTFTLPPQYIERFDLFYIALIVIIVLIASIIILFFRMFRKTS